jgi:hypothetical protein
MWTNFTIIRSFYHFLQRTRIGIKQNQLSKWMGRIPNYIFHVLESHKNNRAFDKCIHAWTTFGFFWGKERLHTLIYSVFFTSVLLMLGSFSFVSDKLNIPNTKQDYGIHLDKYILKLGTQHTVLARRIKRINYQNISLPRCVVSIQRYPSRNLRWPRSA